MEFKVASTKVNDKNATDIYDLGDCQFNAAHSELHSKLNNQYFHIEKKVAQVFHCLARARGEVVTREQIFDQVWPNVIVSDDSLNRCISVLRKNLKTFDHNIHIKTHPKVGFNLEYPQSQNKHTTSLTPSELASHKEEQQNEKELNHNKEFNNTTQSSSMVQDAFTNPKKLNSSLAIPALKKSNNDIKRVRMGYKALLSLVLLILLIAFGFWLIPKQSINKENIAESTQTTANLSQQESSSQHLDTQRLIIMPFVFERLQSKYSAVETVFRQLITLHPELKTVVKNDLEQIKQINSRTLGQEFNARFIIRAKAYHENSRDILHWQLIDALTGDEIFNEQLNLTLNSNNINARLLAAKYIELNAAINFDIQTGKSANLTGNSLKNAPLNTVNLIQQQAYIQFIVDSALFLFEGQSNRDLHHQLIGLLAKIITQIDTNSVLALKTFAQFLSLDAARVNPLNQPYLNLAIDTLHKAITLAPEQADLYQSLASIYMTRYQWQKSYQILEQGQLYFTEHKLAQQVDMYAIKHKTGQLSGELLTHLEVQFNANPLDINKGLSLACVFVQLDQPEKAINIANSLMIKTSEWGKAGALLGPTYMRLGKEQKGKELFFHGYQSMGVPYAYIDILYQGIKLVDYRQQASDYLTESANNNFFNKAILLYMYAELADIDAYFDLAFKLADNYQYTLLSAMRANASTIRKHPRFVPLMEKIGLASYWKSYGLPHFCQSAEQLSCF